MEIDKNARFIIEKLEENGYLAYIVGGCVRDLLMNKTPSDWDITTSARPDDIKRVFCHFKTIDTGILHGTVAVFVNDEIYEVTTMRSDGEYTDNRHPLNVLFVDEIEYDLARRDFTINSMAYNPNSGIIDIFGGEEDIKKGIIRSVGDADARFSEDALRIMRAVRFSSVLGFEIEEDTSKSIHENKQLLRNISKERINIELTKLLLGCDAERVLTDYSDVICEIIPELKKTIAFSQVNKHHCFDVYTHIVKSVSYVEADTVLRMTMLLHDIEKPSCAKTDLDGTMHFKMHDALGTKTAEAILKRLRYSNDFIFKVTNLIRYHDLRFSAEKRAVKRAVLKTGDELFLPLLSVQRADALSQSDYMRKEKLDRIEKIKDMYSEIKKEKECISLSDLCVSGYDLMNEGLSGKQIGDTLNSLLLAVIDDKCDNTKDALLKYAKKIQR